MRGQQHVRALDDLGPDHRGDYPPGHYQCDGTWARFGGGHLGRGKTQMLRDAEPHAGGDRCQRVEQKITVPHAEREAQTAK